jgi:hypothetical protein
VKRLAILALATIGVAALVTSCRQYLPSGRYLQLRPQANVNSTADARHKFDHRRHARPLAAANATCLDCHRFNALIETGNEELARELSAHAQYPGNGACHFCHGPSETRMAGAPGACTTCHDNLTPLRPADHDVAWSRVHAGMARTDPARCESCHRQAECIDCHQRRDTIQTRMHDRNFRFFHSIQARANPLQCSSCHREDFCIRCHERGGLGDTP